ncbi:DUF551 domain-containing protein [Enterobacter asburiae]|uniref:DUF551 domain-containing protein n=1 Tax=Enterobacter asburiae TaxID=61645 RepID=UPI0022792DFE|nr:DUF551 domain-containing protein [Enterobacter asburiae]EMB8996213.1 DUF551 domain-containing protein [Enterobacter asburiae]MCY1150565.1 DUF551 domain-containing protein [Enterobacter asburiae]
MSTITKEWLQQKIAGMEATRDEIPFGLGEDGTNTLAALRIALASLEAEPVGEVSEQRDGLVMDGTVDLGGASTHRIIKGASKMKRLPLGTKFYTAPPAPVSVPDAMEMDDDFDSAFEHGKAVGWNACRAAILQRAEPVQGWIPCSDRMPTKNHRVLIFINFNSDTVPPSIHDAQFTGSTFRRGNATVNVFPLEDGYGVTHWMPLPAAPQQEA